MPSTRYVALLRGINVGGRNRVPMADLRAAVEAAGHTAVRTHLQSGNVLFATTTPRRTLERDLEEVLERDLSTPIVVVVRSHEELRAVVEGAPAGFGADPATFHSDVVFLKAPLTAEQAIGVVARREGVDEAWPGEGVLYFARRSAQLGRSRMSSLIGTPEYQRMTIRSWSTTVRLLELLDEAG